jgi:heptosyltransferase I
VFFAGPSNVEAARLIPGAEVISIPVTRPFQSIEQIRKEHFDLWIDCGAWPRINALFSYFAKASWKVGFRRPGQGRHFVYDEAVMHRDVHELVNYQQLIGTWGDVRDGSLDLQRAGRVVDCKLLVFHLYPGGSRARWKEWPEEKWERLALQWIQRGYKVVCTGGERDRQRLCAFQQRCTFPVELAIGPLNQTAELIEEAAAVVSVDTGILHLATGLGRPTIGLYGPTTPARWGGVGPHFRPIRATAAAACLSLGFEKPCPQCDCMGQIEVEQVVDQLEAAVHG